MNFVVPDKKIRNYLLTDPGKSAFFFSFGYAPPGWERLRDDIHAMAVRCSPLMRAREVTGYGSEYEIMGEVTTPDGRTIFLTTAWFLDSGDTDNLRFVTAYPAKR